MNNPPERIIPSYTFRECNYYSITTNDSIKGNYSNWKINVDYVLITNNSLFGVQIYQPNNRILVTGQTNKVNNGIYVVTNNYWKRSNDMMIKTSASCFITYCNSDNIYYVCDNKKNDDVVGIAELVFIPIPFYNDTDYINSQVVVNENNMLKTKELYVVDENSLLTKAGIYSDNLTIKTFLPNDIILNGDEPSMAMNVLGTTNISTNTAHKGSNIIFKNHQIMEIRGNQTYNLNKRSLNFNTQDNQSIYVAGKSLEFVDGGFNLNTKSTGSTVNFGATVNGYKQGFVTIINDGGINPQESNFVTIYAPDGYYGIPPIPPTTGICYACIQSSDNYFKVTVGPNVDGYKNITLTNMSNAISINSTNGTTIGFFCS